MSRPRWRTSAPTLAEALVAAEGLTDDSVEQIALAAELMQVAVAEVKAEAEAILKTRVQKAPVQIVAQRGSANLVVVERKPARRFVAPIPSKPTVRRAG